MQPRPFHRRIAEIFFACAAMLMLAAPVHADDSWTLPASAWSRPRSGAAVLEMAPVADAVRAWQAAAREQPQARLVLVHAGGEEGSLWAAELRDWLVALGVPPGAIELVPGSRADRLELRLRT